MERRTKRYCVMSLNEGREQYVDSFDLMDQAKLCVLRMQQDFRFALRDKRISFPDLGSVIPANAPSIGQPGGRRPTSCAG